MNDNKKIFDSLKDAGSAAFDVAKDFGGRLQEERAQHAHGAEAKAPMAPPARRAWWIRPLPPRRSSVPL